MNAVLHPQAPRTVSRSDALSLTLTRYFTGEPCTHGHVAERYTRDGRCTECEKMKLRRRYAANPDKEKQRVLQYRMENLETVREKNRIASKRRRAESPEVVRAWERTKYVKMRNDPIRLALEQERQREKQRRAYAENPEKLKARVKAYRTASPERIMAAREKCKEYKKNNPDVIRQLNLKHNHLDRAARLKRVPRWLGEVEIERIRELYKEARRKGLHVDHIIPLQGTNVSGLHVYSNLQLLTKSENSSKRNSYSIS